MTFGEKIIANIGNIRFLGHCLEKKIGITIIGTFEIAFLKNNIALKVMYKNIYVETNLGQSCLK